MPMTEIPELEKMWKEKQELENPKEDTDDNFIPAREAKMNEAEALVHIVL